MFQVAKDARDVDGLGDAAIFSFLNLPNPSAQLRVLVIGKIEFTLSISGFYDEAEVFDKMKSLASAVLENAETP
jgi:hypothetical protein